MISFQNQIKAWKNVLFALFLRELQSKFNDKFGLSWALIEPFMFIFVISYGRSFLLGDDVHGVPVFMFMFLGFLGLMTFTSILGSASTAIKRSKPLFAFRQVQPLSPVITSTLMEAIVKAGVIILGIIAMYVLDIDGAVADPLLLFSLVILLFAFGASIALLFAIAASFVPEIDKLKQMITRPLMFVSAVFFSLQDIPKEFWPYFTWNPLLHLIELARFACYPSYGHEGVDFQYVLNCALVGLFLSLSCYHLTWKRVLSR